MNEVSVCRFDYEDLYRIGINSKKLIYTNKVKRLLPLKGIKKIRLNLSPYPSALYRVTFEVLKSLLEMKTAGIVEEESSEYLDQVTLKKLAADYIDGLGICSIGFSPLWLLAIVNELTDGNMSHINLIQEEYKKYGLLGREEHFESVVDLLEGLHQKDYIDKSYFNNQMIGRIKDDLAILSKDDACNLLELQKNLMNMWEKVHKVCKYENFSVSKMIGIITLDVFRHLALNGTPVGEIRLTKIIRQLDESILDTYEKSIDEFNQKGKKQYYIQNIKPFVDFYAEKSLSTGGKI